MEILLALSFLLLVSIGVFLALIPGIPALLYMLIVAVVFAAIDRFAMLTVHELLILGGIYLLSLLVDIFSGAIGARYGGASFRSVLAGIGGALVGTLLLPPFGGIIGLFAGILLLEFVSGRSGPKAFRAASYGVLGAIAGIIVNVGLAVLFWLTFVILTFFV